MVKQDNEKIMKELRENLLAGKIVIGTKLVSKELKKGNIASVLIANNCAEDVKTDLEQYTNLGKIPLVNLNLNNEELGIFCKKSFFVSVLGVKK
jgi:large subunit ribosomal protein L30e